MIRKSRFMPVCRRTFPLLVALVLSILTFSEKSTIAGPSPSASSSIEAQSAQVEFAPSPQEIRRATAQVLQDPRFQHSQSLKDWLEKQLSLFWQLLFGKTTGGLGRLAAFAFLGWSILTLAAIVAHGVWTLWGVFRPIGPTGQWGNKSFDAGGELSLEELEREIAGFSQNGQYRRALAVLRDLVLRQLGNFGLLGWNESKTNGDFLREVPQSNTCHVPLARLLDTIEGVVYGGQTCTPVCFERVLEERRELMRHVQKPHN